MMSASKDDKTSFHSDLSDRMPLIFQVTRRIVTTFYGANGNKLMVKSEEKS